MTRDEAQRLLKETPEFVPGPCPRCGATTFEEAAVGITHVAPDGRWLRVNPKFCEILGYEAQELLRLEAPQLTHPKDRDEDQGQCQPECHDAGQRPGHQPTDGQRRDERGEHGRHGGREGVREEDLDAVDILCQALQEIT